MFEFFKKYLMYFSGGILILSQPMLPSLEDKQLINLWDLSEDYQKIIQLETAPQKQTVIVSGPWLFQINEIILSENFPQEKKVAQKIIYLLKELSMQGKIELIPSTYTDSILPLLYDNLQILEIYHPQISPPSSKFSYPQDAVAQVVNALGLFKEIFSFFPESIWVRPGTLVAETLNIFKNVGIKSVVCGEEKILIDEFKIKDVDLSLWVGDKSQNLAWEQFSLLREKVEEYKNSGKADKEKLDEIMNLIYILEWEGWYYSYSQNDDTGIDYLYDEIFRETLSSVYRLIQSPVPPILEVPFSEERVILMEEVGDYFLQFPIIDGILETSGCAKIETKNEIIHFAKTPDSFYLGIENTQPFLEEKEIFVTSNYKIIISTADAERIKLLRRYKEDWKDFKAIDSYFLGEKNIEILIPLSFLEISNQVDILIFNDFINDCKFAYADLNQVIIKKENDDLSFEIYTQELDENTTIEIYLDLNQRSGYGCRELLSEGYTLPINAWEYAILVEKGKGILYKINMLNQAEILKELPLIKDKENKKIALNVPPYLLKGDFKNWEYVIVSLNKNKKIVDTIVPYYVKEEEILGQAIVEIPALRR